MAVILFIISSLIFIVFSMISIVIKILNKKVKKLFIAVIILSLAGAITGFCMVSPDRPKYASDNKSYNKNEKAEAANYDSKKIKIYSIQNEESVLIQYNNKNILIDVPKDINKSDYVFKTVDNYKLGKINSIILTSNSDKLSQNAADVIEKYNISDVSYTYDNINDKIVQAIKAVDSVKGTKSTPKKLKDVDKFNDMAIKIEREASFVNMTFKINEGSDAYLIADSFKDYLEKTDIDKHVVSLNHDKAGNLDINIHIEAQN
ncbi:hypothetical protein ACJDT4_11715 [Clostridium neuense]|uniref:Cell division protein FtsQ n=1 Tax=Clostridium neuense TaxID=1728934 RepID=A0ABW8TH39_9CLOT